MERTQSASKSLSSEEVNVFEDEDEDFEILDTLSSPEAPSPQDTSPRGESHLPLVQDVQTISDSSQSPSPVMADSQTFNHRRRLHEPLTLREPSSDAEYRAFMQSQDRNGQLRDPDLAGVDQHRSRRVPAFSISARQQQQRQQDPRGRNLASSRHRGSFSHGQQKAQHLQPQHREPPQHLFPDIRYRHVSSRGYDPGSGYNMADYPYPFQTPQQGYFEVPDPRMYPEPNAYGPRHPHIAAFNQSNYDGYTFGYRPPQRYSYPQPFPPYGNSFPPYYQRSNCPSNRNRDYDEYTSSRLGKGQDVSESELLEDDDDGRKGSGDLYAKEEQDSVTLKQEQDSGDDCQIVEPPIKKTKTKTHTNHGELRTTPHGHIYFRESEDSPWEPTVRHEDNRAAMIADAGRHGSYVREPRRTEAPDDRTSYLESQRQWFCGRPHEWHHPTQDAILYRFERRDLPYRTDPIGPLRWRRQIVLNWEGQVMNDYPDLPLTLSSAVEGWRLESIVRLDHRITAQDFRDRMPSRNGRDGPQGASALGNRRCRFRAANGLISWDARDGSAGYAQAIKDKLSNEQMARNTTKGFYGLSENQLKLVQANNRKNAGGNYLKRAGSRALTDEQRKEREARTKNASRK